MCDEWNDVLVDCEEADISDRVLEDDCESNPLEELELPMEDVEMSSEAIETSDIEPMMISQEEYEWMLENRDADLIDTALAEGRFEIVEDAIETDSPKTLTRFLDMNFDEYEDSDLEVQEDMEGEEITDYESILRGIEEESLRQGFEDINIDVAEGKLNEALSDFQEECWSELSLEEQKAAIENLADYVKEVVNLDNPPKIEYYNREKNGEYGGYNPTTNTLKINEYMLYNAEEAADTIAHELWHAHQHECAENPHSALDYQYRYNFDNYISSELGQEAYENQLVEAEARAFAEQFKERIGRSR